MVERGRRGICGGLFDWKTLSGLRVRMSCSMVELQAGGQDFVDTRIAGGCSGC